MSFHQPIVFALTLLALSPTVVSAQASPSVNQKETQAQICQGYKDDLGGTLIGNDPGTRINMRAGAGTNHPVRHQAVMGDQVEALGGVVAVDGYCWFQVRLNRSSIVGWVRSDFVHLEFADAPEGGSYAPPTAR